MRLTKKEAIVITILLVVAAVYIFYKFVYGPIINETNQLVIKNSKLKASQEIALKEALLNGNSELINNINKLNSLNAVIPNMPFIAESYKFFDDAARNNNLRFFASGLENEINEKTINDNLTYYECHYVLNLNGSYPNLVKFIREIEETERLYSLDSISLVMGQTTIVLEDGVTTTDYNADDISIIVELKNFYDDLILSETNNINKINYNNEPGLNPFRVH